MRFDELESVPCVVETPVDCVTETPGVDPRCSDPAFAAANPTICPDSVRLIVKPNKNIICLNNAAQFRAYLVANGGETLLTVGVTFTSNNPSVLVVGGLSGNGTGIAAGIATIQAEWQGLTAFAQITVLDSETCCDDTSVGMLLLIDNSKSMKSVMAGYGTKLDFAKFAANLYAGDLNTTKDKMAVYSFNESETQRLPMSDDVAAIQAAIMGIPSSNFSTDLEDALASAVAYLNTQSFDQKVIVLFSDGENKLGGDVITVADNFIGTGGVLQVVGVRAYGDGFALLNRIASGGMFVNAYDLTTGEAAISAVRGMKGWFCAGNCTPPGNEVINVPQLTFENFINWYVIGPVDLIGGTPPYDAYNFLPGNGLYVDTNGSGAPWLGHMRTHATFTFTLGEQFELKVRVAGNQRSAVGDYVTKFKIGTLLDEDVEPSSWTEDFTEYTFTFAGDGASEMIEMISQGPVDSPYGNLWDYIRLRNVTTDTVLFEDDFDDENPQFIPPACGSAEIPFGFPGYGYSAYGYSCNGYGCLDEPPSEQVPDPNPPVDLESS